MKVFVYGTLKKGYWNSGLLKGSSFERKSTVSGFMLYDVGFPVALPNAETKVSGEVWDIGDPNSCSTAKTTLLRLDALEGNGRMYNRTPVVDDGGEEVHMYIGHPSAWSIESDYMKICPVENGAYVWFPRRER